MDSHAISILSCVCYNIDEKKSNANMILVMQSVGGRMTVFFIQFHGTSNMLFQTLREQSMYRIILILNIWVLKVCSPQF